MTTKSTTDTTTATIFNEQPIFIGRDTQALIYLCKDGLYAFVAPSMRDLYAAACAEPTIGPHHFAGLVEVIRVNGIHADRLRSEAQLSAVPATRPDITAAGVAMEFADWCEAVVDAADQDDDADFLTSLTKAKAETWAITDADELERVQRVAALEDLDDALEDLPRADLVRLAAMARTFKSRARPVAAA